MLNRVNLKSRRMSHVEVDKIIATSLLKMLLLLRETQSLTPWTSLLPYY